MAIISCNQVGLVDGLVVSVIRKRRIVSKFLDDISRFRSKHETEDSVSRMPKYEFNQGMYRL